MPTGRNSLAPITLLLGSLSLALLALIVLSSGLGFVTIPWPTVIRIIGSGIAGAEGLLGEVQELYLTVVFDVRLPRILTAAAVGSGLALSGVVFQGLLLNPLADPYTLGVSAGAAFGASLALLFDLSLFGSYTVPVFAFACAGLTLAAVIYLSASAGGVSSNNLILSGVIVTAILSAGISLFKYLAQERVSVIVFWLLGSFASCTWTDAALTWSVTAAGMAVFLYFGRDLNLLCLGGRTASSLGVEPGRVRMILLLTGSCLAAVCVSVSGIIGFVGLLVPHMMRSITGPDHHKLLPASLLVGGILLLGADTITRALLPAEVPIGVLTALIGGPFFCVIFRKRQMTI
jgi:iron complex transport system permease protein